MWKDESQSYTSGDVITYPRTALDPGNTFDGNRFVCPISAVYYISATAKKNQNNLRVNVVHESEVLFRLEDLNIPGNTVSNAALVWCDEGGTIQVVAAGFGSIYGSTDEPFTTLNIMMMSN